MKFAYLIAAGLAAISVAASAAPQRTVSGTKNGLSFTASNTIVGVTSTATVLGGGDARYQAPKPKYSGVAALIMEYANGDAFICSGSLLSDRMSIVTAAHCVSGGAGTANPVKTTAYFYGGPNNDLFVPFSPEATAREVSRYVVNAGYTGEVIDQNDIAVVRLAQGAPSWATSYELYDGNVLTNKNFNVAGYGARSDTGGSVGSNLGTGRLRQGDNRYDFRLGDNDFGGFFTDADANGEKFFGTADTEYSYLSDFDNGLDANDASCLLAGAFGAGGSKYCNLGRGAMEVSIAGGDSGGPGFIDGKLSSVNSYGLSFGTNFGDLDDDLNDTFGEFQGYVSVPFHRDFITAASAIPEPGTWALMIIGFGAVGLTARRKRALTA